MAEYVRIEVWCNCRDCLYHDGIGYCTSPHGIVIDKNGKCRKKKEKKK